MTPCPRRGARSRATAAATAAAVAIVVAAPWFAVAQPATAPAAGGNSIALAQGALVQLDRFAWLTGVPAPQTLDVLRQGMAAVAEARKEIAYLKPAAAATPADRGKAGAGAEAAASQHRMTACRVDFIEAELQRRAALALPADHAQRLPLLKQALDDYKGLRVEYRDLTIGRLGYAGEARVQRAMGDLAEADAVLVPVIVDLADKRLAQQPAPVLAVQRVLWLERLETALARNLADGRALAAKLRGSVLLGGAAPADVIAVQWLVLQAEARATTGAEADLEAIGRQLRDPALVEAVPDHQRVGLLARLHRDRKLELLPGEVLQLARLQAAAGLAEGAVASFAGVPADQLGPRDWRTYGLLLSSLNQYKPAADALGRALRAPGGTEADRVALLQAYAAASVKAAGTSADAAGAKAATDALWELARSTPDPAVRRDALRSWGYLHEQAGTFDAAAPTLAKYADDVRGDPYLYLLTARSRWRIARRGDVAGQAPAPEAVALGKEITANLKRLIPAADGNLAPSLVLVLAEVTSALPEAGPRGGLDVLRQYEARTAKADAPAVRPLAALKLRLLMELGLADEAEAIAASLPPDAVPPDAALRLAGMLARRYGELGELPQDRGAVRRRVVQLAQRAVAGQGASREYRASATEAVRLLLSVEAFADAQAILSGLGVSATAPDADPGSILLLAQAMQGQGQTDAASRLLDGAVRRHPDSGAVHLAAAQFQQQLRQWEPAADAYRKAREHLASGSADWWHATLGLADALTQARHPAAAVEVVRVANTLYRPSAPAALLPRIDSILKQTPSAPAAALDTRKD